MKPENFKKLVKGFGDESVTSDEPHVSMRCEENGIKLETVKSVLLGRENRELARVVEDRPKVYKIYYKLSKRTELKVIIDLLHQDKLNIRTVKILSSKYKLGKLRRRFK